MVIEEAIYSYLSGYAGLSALISTRVYPIRAPDAATEPYVTFHRSSTERLHTIGTDPGVAIPRLQFDCWGATLSSAKAVAEQVRDALQDYAGLMGGASGVTVLRCIGPEDESNDYDADSDTYRVTLAFELWHQE